MAWCRRSAEQGLVEAQSDLGRIYLGQKNNAEGEKWIRKAAEQGYFLAQFSLAHLYAEGEGVQQDHQSAYMWILLTRAARCGQSQQLCVERYIDWEIDSQEMRDKEAAVLSAEQIAEATRCASEWLKDHQKPALPPETEEQRKTFLVSHEHGGYASFRPGNPGLRLDYCFGWMSIGKGMIRYISRRQDDGFQIAPAQLKYVKKSGDSAVQIQVETGKKYKLTLINDRFEVQSPDALFEALNGPMGRN
ncbi:MAG: sel1 repeat family protein [Acidobacteria bacterium]|nr:sel1 repeat family protein [Acidobacteriota bacterium]